MGRRSSSAADRRRSRGWCFTWNNHSDSDKETLRGIRSDCAYLVFGEEIGDSGTPHLQGFVRFTNARTLASLKKKVSSKAHWEAQKGTSVQAADYCKKDGVFEEFGHLPKSQGERVDLEEIRDEIKAGATELEIAEAHFSRWCTYRRSFDRFRALSFGPSQRLGLDVFVLVGYTGAGKTRFVHQAALDHTEELYVTSDPQLQWFDGYCQQRWVCIDDFRGGAPFEFLLRLLDVYKMRVPIKGGFRAWNPTTIFITSNLDPSEWYEGVDCAPLIRRIKKTVRISEVEARLEWDDLYLKLFEAFGY